MEKLNQAVIESAQMVLSNTNTHHLHSIIMDQVEKELYNVAMKHARYNQSRAARTLGVSRGTLRTKLKQHFGNEFIGD